MLRGRPTQVLWTLGRSVFVLLVLLVSGCGTALTSVRETAALGERISTLSPILLHGPRYCSLLQAASPKGQIVGATCEDLKVRQNAQVMVRAATLLGAFSSSMADLSQGREIGLGTLADFLSNAAATAVGSQATFSASSAGNKLSGVMALLSTGFRRKELRNYILLAHPHVNLLLERLQQHVHLSRNVLRGIRGQSDGKLQERGLLGTLQLELSDTDAVLRCTDKDQTCLALRHFSRIWSMSLMDLLIWAEDEEEELARFERAIVDFQAAFLILHRRAKEGSPFADDTAMYEEIKDALRRKSKERAKDVARGKP